MEKKERLAAKFLSFVSDHKDNNEAVIFVTLLFLTAL